MSPPRVFEGKLAIITGASRSTFTERLVYCMGLTTRLRCCPRNTLRLARRQRRNQLRNSLLRRPRPGTRNPPLQHLQHNRRPHPRRPPRPSSAPTAHLRRQIPLHQKRHLPNRYPNQQRRNRQRTTNPRPRPHPLPTNLRPKRPRPSPTNKSSLPPPPPRPQRAHRKHLLRNHNLGSNPADVVRRHQRRARSHDARLGARTRRARNRQRRFARPYGHRSAQWTPRRPARGAEAV